MSKVTKVPMVDLKEQAEELGIEFPKNISRVKLEALLAKGEATETQAEMQMRLTKEATKLSRVVVNNLDPDDKARGTVYYASNSIIGMQGGHVEFGIPYHVTQIGLNFLKEKSFNQIDRKGRVKKIKKYQIEYLDPITPKEVKEIREHQALRSETVR